MVTHTDDSVEDPASQTRRRDIHDTSGTPSRRKPFVVILLVLLLGFAIHLRIVDSELHQILFVFSSLSGSDDEQPVMTNSSNGIATGTLTTTPSASKSAPTPTPTRTSTTSSATNVPTSATTQTSSTDTTSPLPKPIPVYIWTNDKIVVNEMKHFVVDGVERSPYLERVYEYDEIYNSSSLRWIVDTGTGRRPSRWCETLCDAISQRLNATNNQQPFPLDIFHWGDDPHMPYEFQHCDDFYTNTSSCYVGRENIRYWKRSMVVDRYWNATTNTTHVGHVDDMYAHNFTYWSSQPISHVSYGVRSDTVDSIAAYLQREFDLANYNDTSNHTTIDLPSLLPRPNDVAHFWPPPDIKYFGRVDRGGRFHQNSHLRDAVSQAIWDWNATNYHKKNVTGFAGLAGEANLAGRKNVQEDYVRALLSYKIIVVAQKDDWEDHYRLMEALSSGALVFTDRMLLLPEGLEEGKSIVVYDNVTDMMTKIEHYLWHVGKKERESIARKGWRIAMTRHRSWHIMERALFGRILSS